MMYLIWNLSQSAYVAPSGSPRSFTKRIELARLFRTRAAANANLCGDERVISIYDIVDNMGAN
jgi:hypothetical protein